MQNLDTYNRFVCKKIPETKSGTLQYLVRKNICYNLQFMEYLYESLQSHTKPTTVIQRMFIKHFIIVAVSIMECIIYYELRVQNLMPKEEWEEIKIIKTNPFNLNGGEVKIENVLYKKLVNPKEKQIPFRHAINMAQQAKIFGSKYRTYTFLRKLSILRNKIHLHIMDENSDTDYNVFTYTEFKDTRIFFSGFVRYYFEVTDEEIDKYFIFLESFK